jgi:hypothetical protein
MALYLCSLSQKENTLPQASNGKDGVTKFLTSIPQNCQGHTKQGQSQPKRGKRDTMTKYNVVSWMDPEMQKGP